MTRRSVCPFDRRAKKGVHVQATAEKLKLVTAPQLFHEQETCGVWLTGESPTTCSGRASCRRAKKSGPSQFRSASLSRSSVTAVPFSGIALVRIPQVYPRNIVRASRCPEIATEKPCSSREQESTGHYGVRLSEQRQRYGHPYAVAAWGLSRPAAGAFSHIQT